MSSELDRRTVAITGAAGDAGRAAVRESLDKHIGTTIPISGPTEMDHEQMAAELSVALDRRIVFHDVPIEDYCESLEAMGFPAYTVQHFSGAMLDYQNGHMSGADDNVETLTGRRSMTVGEFARARGDPDGIGADRGPRYGRPKQRR